MQSQDAVFEQFLQQMNMFNRAVLSSYESAARSLVDPALPPRERFDSGCCALESLTRETLRLESQWFDMVDRMVGDENEGSVMGLPPSVTRTMCSSMNEGVRARAKLWEDAFSRLRQMEGLIPNELPAQDGNPFTAWQAMTNALFAAADVQPDSPEGRTGSKSGKGASGKADHDESTAPPQAKGV